MVSHTAWVPLCCVRECEEHAYGARKLYSRQRVWSVSVRTALCLIDHVNDNDVHSVYVYRYQGRHEGHGQAVNAWVRSGEKGVQGRH